MDWVLHIVFINGFLHGKIVKITALLMGSHAKDSLTITIQVVIYTHLTKLVHQNFHFGKNFMVFRLHRVVILYRIASMAMFVMEKLHQVR